MDLTFWLRMWTVFTVSYSRNGATAPQTLEHAIFWLVWCDVPVFDTDMETLQSELERVLEELRQMAVLVATFKPENQDNLNERVYDLIAAMSLA